MRHLLVHVLVMTNLNDMLVLLGRDHGVILWLPSTTKCMTQNVFYPWSVPHIGVSFTLCVWSSSMYLCTTLIYLAVFLTSPICFTWQCMWYSAHMSVADTYECTLYLRMPGIWLHARHISTEHQSFMSCLWKCHIYCDHTSVWPVFSIIIM